MKLCNAIVSNSLINSLGIGLVAIFLSFGCSSQLKLDKTRQAIEEAPRVGDLAPTFTLPALDGQSETDLASFRGHKPVILFFGSYT